LHRRRHFPPAHPTICHHVLHTCKVGGSHSHSLISLSFSSQNSQGWWSYNSILVVGPRLCRWRQRQNLQISNRTYKSQIVFCPSKENHQAVLPPDIEISF